MPERRYGLTTSEFALVRGLIERVRQLESTVRNTSGRADTGGVKGGPDEYTVTPDVHVARAPFGGIPALREESGTGFMDVPGSAECSIYRLLGGKLQRSSATSKTVYNLNHEAVGGNRWCLIHSDKDGKWWVTAPFPFPSVLETGTGTGLPETGTGGGFIVEDVDGSPHYEGVRVLQFDEADGFRLSNPADGTARVDLRTCTPVTFQQSQYRCETVRPSNPPGSRGDLNEYRRTVTVSMVGNCPSITAGAWGFVQTIACCDERCQSAGTGTDSGAGPVTTGTGTGFGGPCCDCDAVPLRYKFTPTTIADGTVSTCEVLNTTWTMTLDELECEWNSQ